MVASIALTGFAANDPLPGTYIETNFAQGAASGSGEQRACILVGNKIASGIGVTDTTIYGNDSVVPCSTESDVISLFGNGSPLHRAFRRFTKINQSTPLYMLAVSESAGAAATGTVTFVGNASGIGNVRFWLDEEFVDCTVQSLDTPTVQAAALAAAINTRSYWPVTASAALGVVTLTAKAKGPRGNFHRFQVSIASGITTTVAPTVDTALTGGTTADSITAALATLLPKRFYYIVMEAEDATLFGSAVLQVSTQQAPTVGIRQRIFAGNVDALGAAITLATGRNAARAELPYLKGSQWTPFELAANMAAIYAKYENSGRAPETNFAGFGQDEVSSRDWFVPAPRDAANHPSQNTQRSCLNNGLSPIGVDARGRTYLVNRVTTRSLSGAVADYRIRDPHKVTITDFFADDLYAKTVLNFSRKKIANDPLPGHKPQGASVVTPQIYKASINQLIDDYADNDLLGDEENVKLIKKGLVVQRETNPSTRMSSRTPLRPCDNAYQFANAIDQVA